MATGRRVSIPSDVAVTIAIGRDVVTGFVLDAETGKPLVGALVRAKDREAITDAAGAYALGGLGTGKHGIVASAEGHADHPSQVNHAPPAPSVQDFSLDPAVEVFVRVTDERGAPLPGASVTPSVFGWENIFSAHCFTV